MSDIEMLESMYDFLCGLVPRMTPEERLYFASLTEAYYENKDWYEDEEDDEWEDEEWDEEEGE